VNIWSLASTLFKVVKNLPVLIGAIQSFVLAAEATGKPGEDKRDAVVKAIVENFKKDFNIDLEPYTGIIGWLIDGSVLIWNLLGMFEHKSKKTA